MDLKIVNYGLDVILIIASIWMLVSVRGIGGIMGQTLTMIIVGAVILGLAHLIADVALLLKFDATLNNFVHRLIVLIGFALLALGFRQAQQLTR